MVGLKDRWNPWGEVPKAPGPIQVQHVAQPKATIGQKIVRAPVQRPKSEPVVKDFASMANILHNRR